MAEYTYNPIQEIAVNGSAIFNTTIPCNRGNVYHRNESGIFILKSNTSPNMCFARYQVTFNGNIAVPTEETVGPISMALSLDSESILTSNAIVTPTVVDAYFNITSTAFVDIPRPCCINLSVKNTSTIPINLQNANLVITRVA